MSRLLFILPFLLVFDAVAADLPPSLNKMDGLILRVSPRNPDSSSGAGVKTIEVSHDSEGIRIKWMAPERVRLEAGQWPITKIILKKGALWTNGLSNATGMAHPDLWVSGVINLSFNSILWMNPTALTLEDKKTMEFEPGFLGPSFFNFISSRTEEVNQVDSFRRLASLFNELSKKDLNLFKDSKEDAKELQAFFDKFGRIGILDKSGSYALTLDDRKVNVPIVAVGNDYIRYVVLNSANNPLVLSISFDTDGLPEKILAFMSYFHQNMEYQVTSIRTK